MREIKFRAWQTQHKEMYQPLDGYIEFPDVVVGFSDGDLRLEKNDVILEQFTGLKDKNGKEIYEGDIVYNKADKYNYQIIWNERDARFTLGEDSGPLSTYVLGTFWEVIGNIHENPKLLN